MMMLAAVRPQVSARALLACATAGIALALGACSCDEVEPWGSTYITTAEASPAIEPVACDVHNGAVVGEASGAHVDPNLVEIARLEVERDCYKGAAEDLRQRLKAAPGPAALK